jgi:hypothetical protein
MNAVTSPTAAALSVDDRAGATVPACPSDALAWMAPSHCASPAEALPRIRSICALCPDLFDAVLLVVATHRGVSRTHLGAALKLCRPEFEGLSSADMTGLLTAAWNGGKQGFDAVWRTRTKLGRRSVAAAMPWSTTDD